MTEPDFSGYATRNDLQCTDGRTILAGAFEHQDGDIVPLVWQHDIQEPGNVLGHVRLKNVSDGVRAEAFFNQTPRGQEAKELVRHGDIRFLSIFANRLVEQSKRVSRGVIREVSLVLAGANPGAVIDNVGIAHSDGFYETIVDEAIITTGIELELFHADAATVDNDSVKHADPAPAPASGDRTLAEILDTLNDEQETAVNYLLSQALAEGTVQHSDTDDSDESEEFAVEDDDSVVSEVDVTDETESEESDSETDEESVEDESEDEADNEEAGETVQHNDNTQEDNSMTHNLFDAAKGSGSTAAVQERVYLKHDDVRAIMQDTLRQGSLRAALEDYSLKHSIENIEFLFPDAKTLSNEPSFISRRIDWVDAVLNSVRKTPFSRIKTVHADITEDQARAKGYIKGNQKVEEVFRLLKRSTVPGTVYKKQKLDRDDVLDITDLDVIAFVKAEMKIMLSEEIAAAILIGDGRSNADPDKIDEEKIRPIAKDEELYVTTANVNIADANSSADEIVDAVIMERKNFKGTGMPSFYTNETVIGAFLTVKDGFQNRMYKSLADVAAAMRVKEVVSCEALDRDPTLLGIMVNLADYSIGTDRGGEATMFDDFDLDVNKLIYLLETRCSGALTIPKSAIVFRSVAATDVLAKPTKPSYNPSTKVVTIPTVTGVDYFVGDGTGSSTGSALTAGAQAALTVDTWYIAKPKSGYFFTDNVNDEWQFTV